MNMTQCLLNFSSDAHFMSSRPEVVIFFTSMASVLCTFTISANVIVVLSMSRSHYVTSGRCNRGHDDTRISNVLMTSMAGTDVIIGIFVMPLSISEIAGNGEWRLGSVVCSLRVVMDIMCCTLSIYHVVAMAVDRYLAVCRPWFYRSLTPRTAYIIIVVCWSVPLLLVTVPMLAGVHLDVSNPVIRCVHMKGVCAHSFTRNFLLLSFSVSFYIPIVATLALYFMIARTIFRCGPSVMRSCSNIIQPATLSEATLCAAPILNVYSVTWDRVQKQCETQIEASVRDLPSNFKNESRFTLNEKSKISDFSDSKEKSCDESEGVHIPTSKVLDGINDKNKITISPIRNTQREKLDMNHRFARSRPCAVMSENKSSIKLRKMKSVRNIGLVVVCFVVSWLPFSVIMPMIYFRRASIPFWSMRLVSWMGYMNSAWNPLLFCCNRKVRQAVLACKSKNRVIVCLERK